MVGEVCAGVPAGALCEQDQCVIDQYCSQVLRATPSDYEAQIAAAPSGSCVALTPGTYGAVNLPSGVSLFGRGAEYVSVQDVTMAGTTPAMIRGLTVDTAGIYIDAQNITVDSVEIRNSPEDSVELAPGATATIIHSTIANAKRHGVVGFDAGNLTLEDSVVRSEEGPGMWMQCSGGCDCTGTVNVGLTNVAFRGNSLVGVAFIGVDATMANVEISDTTVGDNFEAGGGLSISGCSHVDAQDVRITNNADFGMLIDDSSVDVDRVEVSGNLRGVWVQNITSSDPSQSVTMSHAMVAMNEGIGLGIAEASVGVTIEDSEIVETLSIPLPVLVGGVSASVEDVGDGIAWLDASQVTLTSVTVTSSARASILIDGEVGSGSTISNVVQSGGDEAMGILQQNLPPGGEQPAVAGNTASSVTTDTSEHYSIPGDIAVPPGI